MALAERGLAEAGRILALPKRSELGGEGVTECFAENGLWAKALADLGWLLLEVTYENVVKTELIPKARVCEDARAYFCLRAFNSRATSACALSGSCFEFRLECRALNHR